MRKAAVVGEVFGQAKQKKTVRRWPQIYKGSLRSCRLLALELKQIVSALSPIRRYSSFSVEGSTERAEVGDLTPT